MRNYIKRLIVLAIVLVIIPISVSAINFYKTSINLTSGGIVNIPKKSYDYAYYEIGINVDKVLSDSLPNKVAIAAYKYNIFQV